MIELFKSVLATIFYSNTISDDVWFEVISTTPVLQHLSYSKQGKLRKLVIKFLRKKNITPVKNFELTEYMEVLIAAQACLLILNLGFKYYNGWQEVIIYPDTFKVSHEYTDYAGVVHSSYRVLSGEAWSHGPVILSWQDIIKDVKNPRTGHNVVVHEFAHKLDMLTGSANGMPPLHNSMSRQEWTHSLSDAYRRLNQQLYLANETTINSYAATDPAEFFSVITEYFFTAPEILETECPEVYQQFRKFYCVDTINSK